MEDYNVLDTSFGAAQVVLVFLELGALALVPLFVGYAVPMLVWRRRSVRDPPMLPPSWGQGLR